MLDKYQAYLERFEREKARGYIDEDEQPESYEDFCWNYEEWNRDDYLER
jgi:hypothetical protein